MTKKLFRTLKITCLCMALTAALPIVSFADEQTAAVKEDKMVVKIIHLDENGNPLEADKQTETETAKEETESSEKTTDTEEADADTEEAEADPDEDEAEEEEAVEEIEAAIEVENDLRSEIVTYALQFVGNRYKYGVEKPIARRNWISCSPWTLPAPCMEMGSICQSLVSSPFWATSSRIPLMPCGAPPQMSPVKSPSASGRGPTVSF